MQKLTKEQIENLPEWMTMPDYPSYEVNCRAGIIRNSRTLKVLKPGTDGYGYPHVVLSKDGIRHTKKAHRLVALAAFGHYDISTDSLCVCHLDEERHNPRIDNLAIGTQKENMAFPERKKRRSQSHKGNKGYWLGKSLSEECRKKLSEAMTGRSLSKEHRKKISEAQSKRVGAYKDGKLIMVFQGTREAGRNGFNSGSVSACCTGRRMVHKGFKWHYI